MIILNFRVGANASEVHLSVAKGDGAEHNDVDEKGRENHLIEQSQVRDFGELLAHGILVGDDGEQHCRDDTDAVRTVRIEVDGECDEGCRSEDNSRNNDAPEVGVPLSRCFDAEEAFGEAVLGLEFDQRLVQCPRRKVRIDGCELERVGFSV